jgi:hypothetical protein
MATNKLTLSKEALRTLQSPHLYAVVGGEGSGTCVIKTILIGSDIIMHASEMFHCRDTFTCQCSNGCSDDCTTGTVTTSA